MIQLTDFTRYADAQRHFSKDALWALFDGDRAVLNIAHECLDRHDRNTVALRIAHDEGHNEAITFGELSDGCCLRKVAVSEKPSHLWFQSAIRRHTARAAKRLSVKFQRLRK